MSKNLIAVIDIGSLTARLKIYEIGNNGAPKEIETVRMFTSLGTRSYLAGMVEPEQLEEICDCLRSFDIKCKEYRISRVLCVATSALRDARNRDVIIEQIRIRTGFRIEVLDNSMERFYQNMAVRERMPEFKDLIKEGTMILDIGANSLQATVYDKSDFIFSQNMVLGSLRIYEMLSDLQSKTTHYEDVLAEFIAQDLEDYHSVEPKGIVYKSLVAFGGELGFIKKLLNLTPNENAVLSKADFLKIYDYLFRNSPKELSLNDHIPSHIAPLLLPSAMIIRNMLEYTGVDSVYLPQASLSDGIIYNHCFRYSGYRLSLNPEDDLVRAARNVAKRYRSDKKHIEFVENTAMEIFDASSRFTGLAGRDRLLLKLSAILHETGKYVHARAHNDAAYSLIKYTDLIGLNADELETVALIVRLYPEQNPYENFYYENLPPHKKVLVSKLTAILRIADALDASHKQKTKKMTIVLNPDSLHISCQSDVDMSFEAWSFEHRSGLFEEVIGIRPELRTRRTL